MIGVAGVVGAVFGGILGLFLGLIGTHFFIPKSVGFIRFLLLQIGAGFIGCTIGFIAGAFIEIAIFGAHRGDDPQKRFDRAINTTPLKVALCDHRNADEAKVILEKPLDAKTQKYLGYIVLNCTESAQAKMLIPQMMALLHIQYLAGKGGNDEDHPYNYFRGEKKDHYNWYSYCAVLNRYIKKQDIVRLRELQAQKLPLYCAGSPQQLRLDG